MALDFVFPLAAGIFPVAGFPLSNQRFYPIWFPCQEIETQKNIDKITGYNSSACKTPRGVSCKKFRLFRIRTLR